MGNSCEGLGLEWVRKQTIFLILKIWNLKQTSIKHAMDCVVWRRGNLLGYNCPCLKTEITLIIGLVSISRVLPREGTNKNHTQKDLWEILVWKGGNHIIRSSVDVGQQQKVSRTFNNRFSLVSSTNTLKGYLKWMDNPQGSGWERFPGRDGVKMVVWWWHLSLIIWGLPCSSPGAKQVHYFFWPLC